MGGRCPQCDKIAIGQRSVRLTLRGTGTPVDAVLCGECGTVYVTNDEMDRLDERLHAEFKRKHDKMQTRLNTFERDSDV